MRPFGFRPAPFRRPPRHWPFLSGRRKSNTPCLHLRAIPLGNDCDDDNPAIVPGAQHCISATDYEICQEDGDWSLKATCPGQGCVAQPNGTGICI